MAYTTATGVAYRTIVQPATASHQREKFYFIYLEKMNATYMASIEHTHVYTFTQPEFGDSQRGKRREITRTLLKDQANDSKMSVLLAETHCDNKEEASDYTTPHSISSRSSRRSFAPSPLPCDITKRSSRRIALPGRS